jgi:CheY-like chemotaxis protein
VAKTYSDPEPHQCGSERGQARILVCDDDADVRAIVVSSLRDNGYVVWEAESPARAFEILERERPVDLLIVDYAMPEMNGVAVIGRALALQNGLKALLISGHADILYAGGVSGIPLLAKPFKVAELRQRIAATLFASPPSAEQACLALQAWQCPVEGMQVRA